MSRRIAASTPSLENAISSPAGTAKTSRLKRAKRAAARTSCGAVSIGGSGGGWVGSGFGSPTPARRCAAAGSDDESRLVALAVGDDEPRPGFPARLEAHAARLDVEHEQVAGALDREAHDRLLGLPSSRLRAHALRATLAGDFRTGKLQRSRIGASSSSRRCCRFRSGENER